MAQPSPREFQPYREVQGAAEDELRRILEITARQIEKRVALLKPGIGGVVRASQLRLVLAAIKRLQRLMWSNAITPAIQRQIDAALQAGESAVEALTRVAYTALSDDAAEELVKGLKAAAESGLKTDAARKKRDLSARVYKMRALHEGKVEETIRAGLIAGLSARELAKDVYDYVSPTAKGGASYAAMRLARTEINNAMHERQIAGAKRPGVEAVKWNLSGSHKVPDECNVYAEHEPYDPDEIPDKPHPQCFCYLTYVMQKPEAFREALERGDWDQEIARRTRENMARLGQPVGGTTPQVVAESRVPGTAAIKRSVLSGIKSTQKLSGGKQAETSKVEFNDGTTGVKKFIDRADAKRQQDAEELVPLLARMMGITAPQVTRVDEKTTIQQFLPGRIAHDLINDGIVTQWKKRTADKAKGSPQGVLIAVLDQITFNMDRHDGNWLFDEEGNITIIDHGLAWSNMRGKTDLSKPAVFRMNDPFSAMLTTGKAGVGTASYKKMDLHPEDVDQLVDILNTLRGEFEDRGQLEWWEFSMMQVEAIRPYAQGKKRRINP